MSGASLSPVELLRQHLARPAQDVDAPSLPQPLADVPQPLLLAMALPPCFSMPMLDAVWTGTPAPGALVTRLAEDGLVESDPGALPGRPASRRPGSDVPALSLTGPSRGQVVAAFLGPQTGASGRMSALRAEHALLGQKTGSVSGVPDAARRWAQLACFAEHSGTMVERLDALVGEAAQRKDGADLGKWIDAARPLAALLERDGDASMTVALQRAGRQLELLLREKADVRHLETFFPRPEQIKALVGFVRGAPERWQLHLLGSGGVGKTMLLRQFTIKMARRLGIITARVDFDYLSPDYPRLDPGLLLWALGKELRLRDLDGLATERLEDVELLLRGLRERLRESPPPLDRRPTDDDAFREALQIFIDALSMLPRVDAPQPIVVILDTCEELVKARFRQGPADGVSETFRILGALRHGVAYLDDERNRDEGVRGFRVVFSGRRPLARTGVGWTSDSDLPARPDLEVFELRGFSPLEAERWMRKLRVPATLAPRVLAATPAMPLGARVRWADGREPQAPGLNPYELKHFAEWALETPTPEPEAITADSNTEYVEFRILRRLGDQRLEALLPAIALLRYFDREALEAAVDAGPDFPVLMGQLVDFEWFSRRRVHGGHDVEPREIFEFEEGLRRRLWRYHADRGFDFAALAEKVRPLLASRVLEWDVALLDQADVDAALRVHTYDEAGGRDWWRRVERRIIDKRGFPWLEQLTSFLVGDEQVAGPRDGSALAGMPHPLRADVLAARAAALARMGATTALTAWQEVADAIAGRRDAAAIRLEGRAVIGKLVASPPADVGALRDAARSVAGHHWPEWAIEEALDLELAAAFVAGFEVIVEQAELLQASDSLVATVLGDICRALVDLSFPKRLQSWLLTDPPSQTLSTPERDVVAFAWCLAGRAAGHVGQLEAQREAFERATDLTRHERGRPFSVLDWTPPPDVAKRVRLELGRTSLPAEWIIQRLALLEPARPGLDDIDGDRLAAARLETMARVQLQDFEPGRSDDDVLRELMRTPLQRRATEGAATCNAHRLVPPVALVAARLAAERGRVSDGMGVIQDVIRRSQELDRSTVLHAERALALLAPRLRFELVALRFLADSRDPADAWRWIHATVTCGSPADIVLAVRSLDRFDRALRTPRDPDEARRTYGYRLRAAGEVSPPEPDIRSLADIALAAAPDRRAAAQLLWEVGDLFHHVADDREANQLLLLASGFFLQSGDVWGAFACAARRVVLHAAVPWWFVDTHGWNPRRVRAEVQERLAALRVALAEAADAYRHIGGSGPDWSVVEIEQVSDVTPQWRAALGEWAPWLTRMAIGQVRLRQLERGQVSLTTDECRHLRAVVIVSADYAAMMSEDLAGDSTRDAAISPATGARRLAGVGLLRLAALSYWLCDRIPGSLANFFERLGDAAMRRARALGVTPHSLVVKETPPAVVLPTPPVEDKPQEESSDDAPPPAPSSPTPWFAPAVFGFGILAGIFTLIRPWLRAGITDGMPAAIGAVPLPPLAVDLAAYVLLLLAVLGVGATVGLSIAWWRRRRTTFLLDARSQDGGRSQSRAPVSLWLRRQVPRFPLPGRRVEPILEEEIEIVARAAYRELIVKEPIVEALERHREKVSGAPLRLEVLTEGSAAARAPWEGMLAAALSAHAEPPASASIADALWIRRTVARPPVRAQAGQLPRADAVIVTRHVPGAQFAAALWGGPSGTRIVTLGSTEDSAGLIPGEVVPPSAEPRVLHLIGDPIGTDRDVRLRLTETGTNVGGRDEDPMLIAQRFAPVQLCVLQARLVARFTRRQATDRRDAANLRELAALLHAAGLPIVVAVPPLTVELASTALAPLVETMARRRSRPEDFETAVGIARKRLLETEASAADDAFERAWDVCLFAAGDWPLTRAPGPAAPSDVTPR
jgi:hypothetical protein